jgi:mono/diheme cytochrome c family protein
MVRISPILVAVAFAAGTTSAAETPPPKNGPPPIPPEVSPFLKSPPQPTAAAPAAGKSGKAATAASPSAPDKSGNADNLVVRGKRLVDSHDCHACHTPMKMGPKGPEPDMAMALSGHPEKLVMPPPPKLDGAWGWVGSSTNTAFAGPWGISYAINLTSDPDTGVGKWREEDFIAAIRTGKHLGVGRPIAPPMPWPAYRHLSDTQLRAIFAYLKTVPPVKNRAPEYAPPKK